MAVPGDGVGSERKKETAQNHLVSLILFKFKLTEVYGGRYNFINYT